MSARSAGVGRGANRISASSRRTRFSQAPRAAEQPEQRPGGGLQRRVGGQRLRIGLARLAALAQLPLAQVGGLEQQARGALEVDRRLEVGLLLVERDLLGCLLAGGRAGWRARRARARPPRPSPQAAARLRPSRIARRCPSTRARPLGLGAERSPLGDSVAIGIPGAVSGTSSSKLGERSEGRERLEIGRREAPQIRMSMAGSGSPVNCRTRPAPSFAGPVNMSQAHGL